MTGIADTLRLPRKPQGTAQVGLGATRRRDRWWTAPVVQGVVFTICAVYLGFSGVLWQPLGGPPYEAEGYLSPLLAAHRGAVVALVHQPGPADPVDPVGLPGDLLLLPQGLLPFLFRGPPGCAVGEQIHRGYRMETAFPFILQNLHRYFLSWRSCRCSSSGPSHRLSVTNTGGYRLGLGVGILFLNALLLTGYSLSCHSLR